MDLCFFDREQLAKILQKAKESVQNTENIGGNREFKGESEYV